MEELFIRLRPHGLPRSIRKGANILFQGEVPRRGYLVRDGVVRAYTITSTGEERIVSFYAKGDILPLSWLLGETTNTLFYYEAVTDVRLVAIPKEAFQDCIKNDPQMMSLLLTFISKQYTSMLLRITGLEQSRAVEKIGFTLYYLLFRYGEEQENGIYAVNLKLSQLTIANLVGLTRESTTKNLKILRTKGIITYEHSTYFVNKAKLEAFIGEDSFRNLNLT
ncbi:MAG: CarD family transcriptional regulator [Candidatus Saccharibacteria bacterium]|nr:CarD family transcriptional regulator [Candidatus Saccharibacteria bacterium]